MVELQLLTTGGLKPQLPITPSQARAKRRHLSYVSSRCVNSPLDAPLHVSRHAMMLPVKTTSKPSVRTNRSTPPPSADFSLLTSPRLSLSVCLSPPPPTVVSGAKGHGGVRRASGCYSHPPAPTTAPPYSGAISLSVYVRGSTDERDVLSIRSVGAERNMKPISSVLISALFSSFRQYIYIWRKFSF